MARYNTFGADICDGVIAANSFNVITNCTSSSHIGLVNGAVKADVDIAPCAWAP